MTLEEVEIALNIVSRELIAWHFKEQYWLRKSHSEFDMSYDMSLSCVQSTLHQLETLYKYLSRIKRNAIRKQSKRMRSHNFTLDELKILSRGKNDAEYV